MILLANKIVAMQANDSTVIFKNLCDLFDKKLIKKGDKHAITNAGAVGLQKKQIEKVRVNTSSLLLFFFSL